MQVHGMGADFMSQRVVTDVGNYIGRYIESDANNFVGVWGEFLRARVSIALDKPLRRRMKLKKSDSNWCWVNFKYEGIPTFCFICGLIGHSDKLCEKHFEMSEENIEKIGPWMRAEPRRKVYTMESKWLRHGGATPVKQTGEEMDDVIRSGKSAGETNSDKSGMLIDSIQVGKPMSTGENSGKLLIRNLSCNKLVPFNQESISIQENTFKEVDLNEILVIDAKRRRVENEYGPEMSEKLDMDMCQSPQESDDSNQKNLSLAGAVVQARHSS